MDVVQTRKARCIRGTRNMKDGKFTAGDIYSLLYKRHEDNGEWLCAREVSDGTGWATRRLDFVACNCYSSKGQGIYAYEVKISKSDLRNELFDPSKHNIFFDNIDFFSIVAPDYVLDAEYIKLIPKQWGIVKAVAGQEDGDTNKLVTYRKPLALHDEKSRSLDKDFVFCLMRRLRDDPTTDKTEQEIRNAEFQRGYEEGKRWSGKSDFESMYKREQEENLGLRRALSALGVGSCWYHATGQLVDEATKRALEIKKYEKAYNMLCGLDYDLKTFKRLADELGEVMNPLVQVKDEAENVSEETQSVILTF